MMFGWCVAEKKDPLISEGTSSDLMMFLISASDHASLYPDRDSCFLNGLTWKSFAVINQIFKIESKFS